MLASATGRGHASLFAYSVGNEIPTDVIRWHGAGRVERFLAEQGIGPHYVLQTSSPGFERPVRFPEHWRRFLGREVRVRARVLRGHPRLTIVAVPALPLS